MRVFVAGATGLIGARVVDLLLETGHVVGAHAREEATAEPLRQKGVGVAVADVYDAEQLRMAVGMSEPDVVIHQLSAIPKRINLGRPTGARHGRLTATGQEWTRAACCAFQSLDPRPLARQLPGEIIRKRS